MGGWSSKLEVEGKHAYITGGSEGLGLELAKILAARGAHVTVVSRSEKKLVKAMGEIKAAALSEDQKIQFFAADVSSNEESKAALIKAVEAAGVPYFVFPCAGLARPGYFLEEDHIAIHEHAMRVNYLGTLYTVHAAARLMASNGVRGHIACIGSVISMVSFIGYGSYAPSKAALRSLAELLRNELKPYGIKIHLFLPAGIDSPGLVEENKTKPKPTELLEAGDVPQKPDVVAKLLLKGIQRGQYAITTDIQGEVFRASTAGTTPWNNYLYDWLFAIIAMIAFTFVRLQGDSYAVQYPYPSLLPVPEKNGSNASEETV
ncbi:short chain dehydrogenase/ reductase, partial [Gonapodya prolifera JEL478]